MSRAPGAEVPPPDLPGYRFIENIGAGGNAQVYLYEQHLPRRKVAVKVINESALSEVARRRFTAEANVTAGLAHRHIVGVFEANVTSDGRPYLVMPYYPQPNLSVRARRSHFSVADVLRIGIQVGSAVETSHRSGVLHRDIKPQNILTDSYGEPVLTDFGIATTKGGDGPEGLSVPWSPPEIVFGTGPGDERADVYSLGATLWHLLAGRSPFEVPGDNGNLALMARIKSEPPPRTQRSDVPDSLERLLRQAMAKDPAARPQSALELIRGLQSVEQELRLPLTQPVLPADGPSPDTQRSDTIVAPRLGAGQEAPGRRPDSRLDRPGSADPSPLNRPRAQAAREEAAPTLRRGPVRIDPGRPAGRAPGRAAQPPGPPGPAGPAGPGSWANAPAPAAPGSWANAPAPAPVSSRVRQFPPDVPDGATVARRSSGADAFGTTGAGYAAPGGGDARGVAAVGGSAGEPGHRRGGRGRVLALVGGGAALAVVAGVAVVALSHGGGQPGDTPAAPGGLATQSGGAQNAIGEGAAAPGTPTVKAARLSATRVEFSWSYDNAAVGDSFQWTVSGTVGDSSGKAAKPQQAVTVPAGKVACFEVRVTSAQGEASAVSEPVCWP